MSPPANAPCRLCNFVVPRFFAGALLGAVASFAAPTITVPPQRLTVVAGQPAVFTVMATDSATLSYQWWRGAEAIIDGTDATYAVAAATADDSGALFSVTVASANGCVQSLPVPLTVNPVTPRTFADWVLAIPDTAKRGALDIPAGDGAPNLLKYALGLAPMTPATAAQLPQLAGGGAMLVFRWKRDSRATGVEVRAESSDSLVAGSWTTAAATKVADDGHVETWETTFAAGTNRSFVRLVVAVQTQGELAPSFTTQPQSITVAAGQSATFVAGVSGSPALVCQWRRNGEAIPGATATTYTLPVVTSADDDARFTAVVTNVAGVAVSAEASLAVTPSVNGTVLYTMDRTQSPINDEIAARLRAIAATNPALRNNVFMKVGDSISAGDGLLGAFGTGHIDDDGPSWETNIRFASRPDLKPIVQFFRGGKVPAGGTVTCLERTSLSARVGEAAGWPTAGDPMPLQQEYAVALPRYAVIMYGSNDITWWGGGAYNHVYQLTNYQRGLLRIVDECLSRGVIPVLTTMPVHIGGMNQLTYFTGMARSIAQYRRIPLIDLNRAMLAIGPGNNYGLTDDGVHLLSEGYNTTAWLDANSLHYGRNLRNLVTLDALARLKALIVDNAVAPDALVSRLPGAGTPADPFRIPGLPYVDMRNTQESTSSVLDGYAGSTVGAPGPEQVYRLVLNRTQTLRILALDKGAGVVRVHLLGGEATAASCLASADAMIVRELTAGTYHIVVDSRSTGGEFSLLVQEAEIE